VSFVHRFERPVLAVEVLLLVCFFTGLYFGGGQKEAAMWAAIGSGFWAQVFWLGVVGIGMLLPQLLALLAPAPLRAKTAIWCWSAPGFPVGIRCCATSCSTGQMTVV
jgi:protein NrfD